VLYASPASHWVNHREGIDRRTDPNVNEQQEAENDQAADARALAWEQASDRAYDLLQPLIGQPRIEIREYIAARFNTILRFDEQMLVTLHLWAQPTIQHRSCTSSAEARAACSTASPPTTKRSGTTPARPLKALSSATGSPPASRSQFRTWRRMNLAATCRRRPRRPTIPPDHVAGPDESDRSHHASACRLAGNELTGLA
jgi:hypothetical protein